MSNQFTTSPEQKQSNTTPSTPTQSHSTPTSSVQLKAAVARAGSYDEQVQMLAPVQRHGGKGGASDVHAAAAHGISGSGGALPHGDTIQQSFGGYDIGIIQAHTDAAAAQGSAAMGADAYATGSQIAFAKTPDLHTAAHEAAHVVQQQAGVSLSGGVGQKGDAYEQHADRVADAVVQGKSAEPILSEMAGGGGPTGVQKKAVQRAGGGGPVTLDDYAKRATGKGEEELDVSGANAKEDAYANKDLDEWQRLFEEGLAARSAGTPVLGNRTEEEMLAAIKANTAPRYLARVGPKRNFNYKTFGHPGRDFIFATEPADLIGCTALEAMIKVGWTETWIRKEIGEMISVAVLDTSVALPRIDAKKNPLGGDAQMTTGRMEWPEITAKALNDATLIQAWADLVDTELEMKFGGKPNPAQVKSALGEYLALAASLSVGAEPSDSMTKELWFGVRMVLDNFYGANPLYSGMGATVDEAGNAGAREVMLNKNDTGFALTSDNSRVIDLGTFTAENVNDSFTPPPSSTGGTK